jgi:hypothetical protein
MRPGFVFKEGYWAGATSPIGDTRRQVLNMSGSAARLSHRRPFIRPDPLMLDTEVDLEPHVSPLSADTALPEAMLCSYDD